jgi:hypothetical protein
MVLRLLQGNRDGMLLDPSRSSLMCRGEANVHPLANVLCLS